MMNEYQDSNKDGAIRELVATKMLMKKGFTISIPNMDVRYDLIAEKYPFFIRVQVKNLSLKSPKKCNVPSSVDTWHIKTYSSINGEKRPYSNKDCDVIMGICLDSDDFAIIPIKEVTGKNEFRLSQHKDSKGKDYFNSFKALEQFEANLPSITE